jgi:sugar (pentulose or hexulose) kinase
VGGIGIDSWAVDFGLLDCYGNLLQNPVCYRDKRTEGMFAVVEQVLPTRQVFELSGIALIPIYTLCQLKSLQVRQPELLQSAHHLLLMPDLLNYFLCGEKGCERTNAITTQLYDPRKDTWCQEVFDSLDLPLSILPPVTPPGRVLGELHGSIKEQVGLSSAPIISVCSHDTGSAVAAVPASEEDYAFISSGTWSVVGMMTGRVITTEEAFAANVCNELTAEGLFLCRNIMGLWLLQQVRALWARKGQSFSYDQLVSLAKAAPVDGPLIHVDDSVFLNPSDMVEAINDYCRHTGQSVTTSTAAVVRCILESLALGYRHALNQLGRLTGKHCTAIYIVGGGSLNSALCQFTADVTGLKVLAGPQDATAAGNILVQALACGDLKSTQQIREVVKASTDLITYVPGDNEYWQKRCLDYDRLLSAITQSI